MCRKRKVKNERRYEREKVDKILVDKRYLRSVVVRQGYVKVSEKFEYGCEVYSTTCQCRLW